MAELATTPVFACRYCGKPVVVTHLSSRRDPDASKLKKFMASLGQIALCKECRARKNWLAAQGRESEFLMNPTTVIYAVRDESGADYYGREMK